MVPIEPVWHAVLRVYRQIGGVGLSGNMLCHLTGLPWEQIKAEAQFYYDDQFATDPTNGKSIRTLVGIGLYTGWCYTERARLLIYNAGAKPVGYPMRLDHLDEQIANFPPTVYPSIHNSMGQKTVNCFKGEPTYRHLQEVVRSYGLEPGDAPYQAP